MRQYITFFVWFIMLLAPAIHSATYHVGPNNADASDRNDGLSPKFISGNRGPWKTLSKAGVAAKAGDTVLVYDGDYRQEDVGWGVGIIPLMNSGRSRSRQIQFMAAPGHQPILKTFLVRDRKWLKISGFTFINPDLILPRKWKDMPEIVVDKPRIVIDPDEDWSTREQKVRLKYATYLGITDYFESTYVTGIDIKNCKHVAFRENMIHGYAFGVQVRGISSKIVIEDNEISYCGNGIFTWRPKPALSHSIIRDNYLHDNFWNAIDVRVDSKNVLIKNNLCEYNGISHITLIDGTRNCTVRGNVAQFGGYYSETMHFPGSTAINIHSSRKGIVVNGNFAAYQIDLTGNDGNGYIADLMKDGAGVLFRNNIAFRNMGLGIRPVKSPNCIIVNNSLIENGHNSGDLRTGAGINLSQGKDLNQTIMNNIFYNNKTAGIKSFKIIDSQKRINHNLYFGPNGAPFIWDGHLVGDRAYHTLPEIRKNTRWENNGQDGDPQFIDAENEDFRLLPGSQAIDTGRKLSRVRKDYDGKSRPQGPAYDIGAFEFGGKDGRKD